MIKEIRVENMKSSKGHPVRNQFVIYTDEGIYFQSYETVIAFKPFGTGKICLDSDAWDYSVTTGKYRNLFLGETKRETEGKIESGVYRLCDLN